MNYGIHPQCAFCRQMSRYVDFNHQREGPHYHVKSYAHYPDRPLIYCYDMTQRPQDNYITYCNIVNNFPGDHEPQYVQVIDPGSTHGRVQFCVPSTNRPLLPPSQPNVPNKLVLDRAENCGVVLCTCNDFINNNMQNRIIYDSLPGRDVVPQFSPNRDSIDSIGKSFEDQPDNSIYSTGSLLSDPMCRFCHLSKNTQSDQLISPCYCCGTLKYVHQNCLKTWLEVSKKQRENNGNKSPHCELCNFKYVRKRKFQFGKIRQPKLSQNDCALHLIFLCSLLVMVTSASVTILCFAMEKSAVRISSGNRMQLYDKPSDTQFKFNDRKSSDMSKSGNILCEYLTNLNMKDYTNSQRQSASKLSVICDLMLNKDHKPNKALESSEHLPEPTLPTKMTNPSMVWKKDSLQKSHSKQSGAGSSNSRLWILTPEEAVTLASGVIFFIAFFIAMVVQVKSSYTCYQLVMQWIRLNYTQEVQSLNQPKKTVDVEMKPINKGADVKHEASLPREYIERCVTEI